MLKHSTLILIILMSLSFAQQSSYRSTDEIKNEWTEYTDYQRDEMVSFCDFLFQEKYYERCLLTCFQFMYRFPQDPIEPVILYHIARCYEEIENYELAVKFYQRARSKVGENSIVFKASENRENYVHLKNKNYLELFKSNKSNNNPYHLIFKGYASMDNMDWVLARQNFIEAEKQFNHPHYSKLLGPVYQIIENIQGVPQYKKLWVTLSGVMIPGGGHFILKDWFNGHAIFLTMSTMMVINYISQMSDVSGNILYQQSAKLLNPLVTNLRSDQESYSLNGKDAIPKPINLMSSDVKYKIPPLVLGLGIYGGSIWQSSKKTQEKNIGLVHAYIVDRMVFISPDRFIDFAEPTFIEK